MMTIIGRFISALCWVAIRSYWQIKQEARWSNFLLVVQLFCGWCVLSAYTWGFLSGDAVSPADCTFISMWFGQVCVYIDLHTGNILDKLTHHSDPFFSTSLVTIHPWLSSLLPPSVSQKSSQEEFCLTPECIEAGEDWWQTLCSEIPPLFS